MLSCEYQLKQFIKEALTMNDEVIDANEESEILEQFEQAEQIEPAEESELSEDYAGNSRSEKVLNYMKGNYRFGTDSSGKPYMVEDGDNPIAVALCDSSFAKLLRYVAYSHGDMLKGDDVKEVVSSLGAYAEFEGEDNLVIYHRVAPTNNGGVEFDKVNEDDVHILLEDGKVTEFTAGSKNLFKRTDNMMALPELASTGDWKSLLPFLNMPRMEKYLFIAWLTYTLSSPRLASTGYVYLLLMGSHGCGKSFLAKSIIRRFVDPITNGMAVFPKEVKDMAIGAQNAHLLVYDNIRTLSHEWSDFLCIAATGGTINGRALYTNSQEHVLQLHAPVVMTSLHHPVKEPDLASRGLTIHLSKIVEKERKEEKVLADELDRLTPSIYRGLLELVAKILQKLDTVEVIHPARMIGFSKWLAAMEICITDETDITAGDLQKAYCDNIRASFLESLQEDVFAFALLEFAKQHPAPNLWKGTPAQLLAEISVGQPVKVTGNAKVWPANPISLGKRLPVVEKSLDAQGVVLVLGERGTNRWITIGMKPEQFEAIEET